MFNLAHFNLETEKLKFFFDQPVLIKTIYYPSFIQDTFKDKPITRDYFFVSAYNEDTNHDSLINYNDLRHFFYFDSNCENKTLLLPEDYSAQSSEYDSENDIMYIFAKQDENHNGTVEPDEPLHVFYIELNKANVAKVLYKEQRINPKNSGLDNNPT